MSNSPVFALDQPRTRPRLVRVLSIVALVITLFAVFVAHVSAETATSGPRTFTVSKATGLNPDGETVFVSGSGYDETKGIYVAFCVVPAPGAIPSPCGGGADISGTGGASLWYSSNPPSYAVGLAVPYGPGGTFSGSMTIGVMIGSVDCRVTACAIVTRSDHTRLQDRSQDVIIPVTFQAAQQPTAVPPTATQPPAATATAPPGISPTSTQPASPTVAASIAASPTPAASAPPAVSPTATPSMAAIVLSQDNRTATRGGITVTSSKVASLNPAGEKVTVSGKGFDDSRGIYVALCAIKGENGIGTCASGSAETSAWISSNPPSYASGRAKAYGSGGSFEATLTLQAVIDDRTDCRRVKCAIATRNDDTVTGGTPQEILVPVTFEAAGSPGAGDSTASAATGGDDGGTPVLPLVLAGAGLVVALGVGSFLYRKKAAAIVTSLVAVNLVLGACGSSGGQPADASSPGAMLPVTVHSADGKDVTITSNARIVTLWGNITEVVVGLGLTGNLVGRDVTSTLDEVSNLPEVTKAHDLSVEGVLSLNPTVVIGSKDNSGPADAIAHLRNVGVPVVIIDDPKTVEDIGPRIQLISKILGVPEKGDVMAAKAETDVHAVLNSLPKDRSHPKVAFLYMRGNAGVYLIGGPGSGADSMIVAAGGQDAGTEMGLSNPFTPLTSEALAKAAPDVILMSESGLESVGGVDGLVKIPGIAQTPAGRSRAIITMGEDLLYNFGLRTPTAIEKLSTDIYAALKANN